MFFPILALFIPREPLLISLGALTAVFTAGDLVRLAFPGLNEWAISHLRPIMKSEESHRMTGTSYLLLGSLATFVLFELDLAVGALFFLSVGDAAAAIVGQRLGRRRLFKKSLEGSLACLGSSLAVGASLAILSPSVSLAMAVAGAVSATVIELLPIPLDDNLTIPLFSAAIMKVVALYLG